MARRFMIAGALGAAMALLVLFVVAAGRVMGAPEPEAAPSPVGESTVLPQTEGYALWGRQDDGSPVRWDPCTPIRWELDARRAPEAAREAVTLAMARITAVSGLPFEFVGMTQEGPDRDRPLVTDGVEGEQWAPVLITWVPADTTDLPLSDAERGVAIPVAVSEQGGPEVFVSGQIVLNADKTLLPMFGDRHASWGAVLLHEIGHLVGLDHVEDPAQLMAPTPGFGEVRFGDGDRAGLTAVGADQGCVDAPAPRDLTVTYD